MSNRHLTKLKYYANARPGFMGQLAEHLSLSPSYLSQMVSGYRSMPPSIAVAVERFTDGQVTRVDCRPNDGLEIWPEFNTQIKNQEGGAEVS